jgi:RNA polymerase sigma-70 factor (ECF subfamily)
MHNILHETEDFSRFQQLVMPDTGDSNTSVTLLERLHQDPADAAAWNEFMTRYRPKVCEWCLAWGVQPADADDVAQVVMAKLLTVMKSFRYDPAGSFRAWLKTVSRRAWLDLHDTHIRASGGADATALFQALPARDELEQRLGEAFDRELFELAMDRVRKRVEPLTWQSFHLTAIEGVSGAEAAQRLVIPVGQVFVAKHRVQKMLRETIRDLEEGHT